ncbi:outer membrane protein assembly factor BamB family protein [Nocardia rhizosphaerae]|uniref:PQQ-binding-like beta-propeller repeat protein n=1 Tax=Nocardia rhizosphaerae TaxID=1691571 RepID=A0ABV8LB73_9NOCA
MSSGSPNPGRRGPAESLLGSLFDSAVAVIPIRPLTLNDLIVGAVRAVARHWRVTVGFTAAAVTAFVAVFLAALFVVTLAAEKVLDSMASSTDMMTGLIVGAGLILAAYLCLVFVLGIPCDAAINGVTIIAANQAIRGAPVAFAEVVRQMRQRFWPLCRLMAAFYVVIIVPVWLVPILLLLAGAGPAVFMLFPLIFVAEFAMGVLFSLAPVVLVVEGTGVTPALKRSVQLARPAFWRLLGLHTAWAVLIMVVLVLITMPFGLATWLVSNGLLAGLPVELAWAVFLLAYLCVALPVFRTAQALVYTDLRIRQGDYGDQLRRERAEQSGSCTEAPVPRPTTPRVGPVVALRPYHLARVGIATAVLFALLDFPGIPWLIIAAGCGYVEWRTRTNKVPWPPRVHDLLVSAQLAEDTEPTTGTSTPSPPDQNTTPHSRSAPQRASAPHVDGGHEAPEDHATGDRLDGPSPAPNATPTPVSLRKPSRPTTPDLPTAVTALPSTAALVHGMDAGAQEPTTPSETSVPLSTSTGEQPSSASRTLPTLHHDQTEPAAPTPPHATPPISLHKPTIGTEPAEPPTPGGASDAAAPITHPAMGPRPQIEQPTPLSPTREHNAAVVIALGIVALLALGAGAVWYLFDRTVEPSANTGTANSLRATFPQRPDATWSFDATSVFAGAKFAAPVPSPTGANPPGFLDLGEVMVTIAVKPGTDQDPVLVAIEADTGALRWHTPLGFYGSCAANTVDGLLPCFSKPGPGPDQFEGVSFFRISDGSVDHRIPISNVARVAVVGHDVITAGYDRISRGTTSDLRRHWSVERTSTERCPGSGDTQYFGATEDFVYFGNDAGSTVLRAHDGIPVVATDAISVAIYPGRGLTAAVCPGGSRSVRATVVVNAHGEHLRTHETYGGFTAPLVLPAAPDLYLIDGAAYDFASGERVWSAGSGVTDIIDSTVVHLDAHTLSAHEFATGTTRWTTTFEASDSFTVPFQWLTDRERVIFAKDEHIEAIDLGSGAITWSIPAGDGNPQRAGDGFATIDASTLTYYAPTGPPTTGPTDRAAEPRADSTVTRCPQTPELTPVHYRTSTEGLIARMELRATCAGGDIVSTNALRVRISDRAQTIADGVFDFSHQPLVLPPADDSTAIVHEFVFPVGTFWRLPNTLGGSDPEARQINGAFSTHVVTCTNLGAGNQAPQKQVQRPGPAASSTAVGAAAGIDAEAAALDALRAQADADRPWVQRDLADRWLPQLSSKQPGLVAPDTDGRTLTWTATTILEQHLRLRLQYPEVRLVRSDEWRTFDLRGWWVTIAGTTFPDPDSANNWCDAKRIPIEECFAKVVSDTRDPQGTTRYRHR